MPVIYHTFINLAQDEFKDVVTQTKLIGGTSASPNKLRLLITDGSFLDIWLSVEGDYAYHWERRGQTGAIYRWDNAPHHPQVSTFPHHCHKGDEPTVIESNLNSAPELALREILKFVREQLS